MEPSSSTPSRAVTLIGHPFAPIGRGEDVRCAARAAQEVRIPFSVLDLDRRAGTDDRALAAEFAGHLTSELSSLVNVFFINGDEVQDVLARFPQFEESGGVQVIVPQWELDTYPEVWAEELERFDEIWAPSRFVARSTREAVSIPVHHIPLPVGPRLDSFLSRRYFGLPESSVIILFSFDFSGYMARKNPTAVLEVFERVCQRLGPVDLRLVLKSTTPWSEERFQEEKGELVKRINRSPYRERIIHINRLMTDNEMKNLIRNCDSYLSLHRAEGFGRGLAEAMYFGIPVIGTGYSGNTDFMEPSNALLVDYQLIPVREGEYPFHEDQVWADPDIPEAVDKVVRVTKDREAARRLGREGSRQIRTHFSYRAVGLRYRKRIRKIKRSME